MLLPEVLGNRCAAPQRHLESGLSFQSRRVAAALLPITPHCQLPCQGSATCSCHAAPLVEQIPCGASELFIPDQSVRLRLSRCRVGALAPRHALAPAVWCRRSFPRVVAGSAHVAWQLPSCRGTLSRGKHLGAACVVAGFHSGWATRSETPEPRKDEDDPDGVPLATAGSQQWAGHGMGAAEASGPTVKETPPPRDTDWPSMQTCASFSRAVLSCSACRSGVYLGARLPVGITRGRVDLLRLASELVQRTASKTGDLNDLIPLPLGLAIESPVERRARDTNLTSELVPRVTVHEQPCAQLFVDYRIH